MDEGEDDYWGSSSAQEFDPNEVLRRAALEKAKEEGIKLEDVIIPQIKMEQFSDYDDDFFGKSEDFEEEVVQ